MMLNRRTLRAMAVILGILVVVLVVLSIFTGRFTQEAPECPITVQPGESIQAAIDQAPKGAVICLGEGTWQENIKITKPLTLRGQGSEKTVIEAVEQGPVVKIEGEGIQVVLEGLKITGAHGLRAYGVLIRGSARATLEDCTVSENWNGIGVRESAQATIEGCTISENRWYGIVLGASAQATITGCTVAGNKGIGISLRDNAQATIEDNVIQGNERYGIYSRSTGEVQGQGNQMRDNGVDLAGNLPGELRVSLVEATEEEIVFPDQRYPSLQHAVDALLPEGRLILKAGEYETGFTIGKELEIVAEEGAEVTLEGPTDEVSVLSLVGGAKALFRGLRVTGGESGFLIAADAQARIRNCTVSENWDGILLLGSAQAMIEDCTVSENKWGGIVLLGRTQATITGCTVAGNGAGIVLRESARAMIEDCTVSGNEWNGIVLGSSAQTTITGCTVAGNEWDGIVFWASAQATIEDNVIQGNERYGIYSRSDGKVQGQGNQMRDNGVDLAGNLPGDLRVSLVEATEEEIVFPDQRYPSLQHAVDALLPEGRLILKAGEYETGFTIGKELEIVAEEGAEVTLKGPTDELPVLSLVGGAKAVFQGLWVTGGRSGFLIAADAQATIEGCTVSENWDGILLLGSAHATIEDCTVLGNRWRGIELLDRTQATITGCTVTGNGAGIVLEDSTQATITGCNVSGNKGGGISLRDNAQATIEDNVIQGNAGYGVALSERPCFDTDWVFTGYVAGKGNTIQENGRGDLCPEELHFLTTEEGGELDRRKQP